MSDGHTRKRIKFAREYIVDFDPVLAAKRAGFPTKEAFNLLKNGVVQSELRKAFNQSVLEKVTKLDTIVATVERVVNEYECIAFFDPMSILDESGCIKPMSKIPETSRRAIIGIEAEKCKGGFLTKVKVRIADKTKALDSLAKVLQMFTQKIEVDHKNLASVAEVDLSERIEALTKGGRDEHMRKAISQPE
jgi:hypothetical protein